MASITTAKNGTRILQFYDPAGKRRSLRLGKITLRAANSIAGKIEHLVSAKVSDIAPGSDIMRWLGKLDAAFLKRLANLELIEKSATNSGNLGEFLDQYLAARTDVKLSTKTVLGHTRRNLLEFFGADAKMKNITPGDADEFRIFLTTNQQLADNTVRRRMGIAKQYFTAAIRRKLITENPFAGQACNVRHNPAKFYFVTRKETVALLDACQNIQWKMIIALTRFGGLRCPSEVLRLKWEDINWDARRFIVHASKTEHHADAGIRQVPIFLELMPILLAGFEAAESDDEFVITQYRDARQNLRSGLNRIIKRAGLKPWPKLFQNMRSTRETELAEEFPLQAVCSWIGNSPAVAARHYLQTRDEHFDIAAGLSSSSSVKKSKTMSNRI